MLHAQSRGNGIHKSRANGEDAHQSMTMLAQPQVADEIRRVMMAVHSGQIDVRARIEGFEPEECELLQAVNQLWTHLPRRWRWLRNPSAN
jgi:hypothetical protein